MPRFAYVAKRGPDEVLRGVMEADHERGVATRLLRMGCHPCSISRWREGAARNPFTALRRRRVRLSDLSVFTRQLSDLIDAGLPVGACLSIVAEQSSSPGLREAVSFVQSEVDGGESLSEAFRSHPQVFPRLTSAMVQAGEEGGMLPDVLARLADYYERSEELSGKVKAALAYPVFLLIVGGATVFVLMSFVVPKFVALFQGFGADLPVPTRVLIRVSVFLGNFWWVLLFGLLAAVMAIRRAAKTTQGRAALDRVKLALPFVGSVLSRIEVARFTRTFGILLEHGVPVLSALDVAGQTIGNVHVASPVSAMAEAVRDGKGFAETLEASPYFPPMVTSLIVVGYASGDLTGMLSKAAAMCDREVERTTQVMTRLLEPVLILVLGGVVALIVAGILLPVFQINVLVR